jgi:uncharacterized protein YjbI with pentapeptide repeats
MDPEVRLTTLLSAAKANNLSLPHRLSMMARSGMPLPLTIVALLAAVTFVVLAYRRGWTWTGFTGQTVDGPVRTRTLWDWLQLLVVPLVIAAAAFEFSSIQNRRQNERETREAERERTLARATALNDARESALRAYLDQMADLLINRHLARSPSESVRQVARSSTMTLLRRLDGKRKGFVIRFLADSGLIETDTPSVGLRDADLRRAQLRNAMFVNTNFGGADMRDADLRGSTFVNSRWEETHLHRADFRGADLSAPFFLGTKMRHADFRHAHLYRARFEKANLRRADFSDATLARPVLIRSCISGARFVRVDLSRVPPLPASGSVAPERSGAGPKSRFAHTGGHGVSFVGADLRDADLDGLHVADSDMTGARVPSEWRPDTANHC